MKILLETIPCLEILLLLLGQVIRLIHFRPYVYRVLVQARSVEFV